jgi:subtilisin family serine protease/N-acetylneuraminic acid mutarotase
MVLIGSTSAYAEPAPDAGPDLGVADKIEPELRKTLQVAGEADFWIRFVDQADLSQARQIDDWVARGAAVADALRETAQASQAEIRQQLDQRQVDYQAFWATNAIYVHSGEPALAQQFAISPEVEGLYAPVGYELIEPLPSQVERQVTALEWGIANINADDVWDQFGVRGEGITVASIDTGVQFDHPALVAQYRGNLGDGTFDHNYNWFDAAGACPDAPCDFNGHGTHTMGTMVGDDGAENQIGVAPEANWITTNGCCPSDPALVASGEWLLEPTDLNGENPDASKRPHIINNSWGSQLPSTDPFMEDVLEAWDASGILGIWANGNSGEFGCNSSGSPGSRIINYSVGAYDINNEIASFSGRGPGQDGEIKPNISAPGVNVRSSLPGDSYGAIDGTSMAAPHVAGTVALLWSAAPTLVGETDATRALLDQSAIDTEDLQCGGTAEDNNVYGEGRLDALALLQLAPVGDAGTLTGTVTDAGTGDPIEGARVTVTGASERELTTGPDGGYSVDLAAGDYTVTASAFGYGSESAEVSVVAGETTTQDFALTASPTRTISGLVRDGSGHGWPMYAELTVQEFPEVSTFTNPFTGRYQLRLPAGATYTLLVEPRYPGYQPLTETVEVGDRNVVRDLAMTVDQESCPTAPGYEFGSDGLYETFEGGTVPAGWTVVDNVGNGQVWRFDDPADRGNLTGGTGGFAIVDSDFYGSGNSQDTELVSPVIDLSDVAEPVIRFHQDFNWFSLGADEFADVDLSVDGGATWETVLHQSAGDVRGPREETIAIPQAAGEPDVRVRFHYGDATFEFWWQVDDVLVGSEITCDPVDGGLVAGHVRDRNTGDGVNGASVTSVDDPTVTTETFATPDDPRRADGFYWMFSPLTGQQRFTAAAGGYSSATRAADVAPDWTTQRNFRLAAGQLSVDPGAVEAEIPMGGSAQRSLTITNTGTAPAQVELTERDGSFEILRADETRLTEQEIMAGPGAEVRRIDLSDRATVAELASSFAPTRLGGAGSPAGPPAPSEEPWTDLPSLPRALMDNNVVTVDGKVYSFGGSTGSTSVPEVYEFDPATQAWTRLDDMPTGPRHQAAEGVIDGKVYLVSGWSDLDTTTAIFDPASGGWSEGAPAPAGRSAAGSAVLDGQLYVIGGCTTGNCTPTSDGVFRYDPASDSWQTLASYPLPIAFQSCGAIGGQIYCAGGMTGTGDLVPTTDTYAYDPASDTWTQVADMPANLWGSGYFAANDLLLISGGLTGPTTLTNEGYAYDPATDSWSELPASNNLAFRPGSSCGFYKVGGDEAPGFFQPTDRVEVLPGFDRCGSTTDVPWLSVSPTTATLAPGESVTVTVSMRADVAQPGTYTAGVRIGENTPYPVAPVDVTMTATPPDTWGKLMGTVTATDCGGDQAPLAEATVHLSTWAMELTLFTDEDGTYAHWLDHRHNPITMIVAKDGYQPQVRQVEVVAGEVTVEAWNLRRVCSAASAGPHLHPM